MHPFKATSTFTSYESKYCEDKLALGTYPNIPNTNFLGDKFGRQVLTTNNGND